MNVLTRSTIVQTQTKLRRERLLPQPGEVVVTPGQEVSPVQVVARTHYAVRFHIIPASEIWHIPAEDVAKYLVVSSGTEVHAGDALLQKKRLVGNKTLESPLDGTFFGVDNGRLILQQHEWLDLRALVRARVVNSIPRRGIVLEIFGTQIQGVWGSGKEGYGKLRLMVHAERGTITPEQIDQKLENQVVVVGSVNQPEILGYLQKVSVSGLIVGTMGAALVDKARTMNYPIVLTDGYGVRGMAANVFRLLGQHEGGDAALFAREPDYWGNRPEIILPHESTGNVTTTAYRPLTTGQTVRLLRAPYASQVGEVVRLNRLQQATESGSRAHGADIKLADGTVVFVPYANLDTIV